MSHADRLVEAVAADGLDQLIVADLVNPGDSGREAQADVFWLTGFTGTSALCVVGPDERLFLSDFRYTQRSEREVDPAFDRVEAEGQPLAELARRLRGRVGYDDARTSVRALRKLSEAAGDDVELVAVDGVLSRMRRHKDAEEVRRIAAAAELTDQVYEWMCERGFIGRTERDVRLAAEQHMRELGAQDPSFPTIVAAGENAALPHHEASDREIGDRRAGDRRHGRDRRRLLLGLHPDLRDGGARRPRRAEVYELVRSTQAAALKAVGAGVTGKDADSVSREPIAEAGHAEHYGHGLGHGVGIEVHEAPRLSQRSEDTLAAGDVVTVEPGVYVPGRCGVRIEDLVAITDDGLRNLSSVGKDLRVVA